MQKDVLKITTNGEFGEIWSLQEPADIAVELKEPLRKSIPPGMIGFVTPEVWTVVLDLYSVPGLKEWIASKVFDVAFDFIKAAVKTKRILPPKISLSITCPQSGETINVSLDGTAADVSSLQLELKTKYADGTKSKKVIKIKPK